MHVHVHAHTYLILGICEGTHYGQPLGKKSREFDIFHFGSPSPSFLLEEEQSQRWPLGSPSFSLDHLANPHGLPGGGGWEGLRFSQSKWGVWPLSLAGVGVRSLTAMGGLPVPIFCYLQMRSCTQLQRHRDRNEVQKCLSYEFNL